MTLMKRSRGATYAAPVAQWSSTYSKPHNVQQDQIDTRFAKLLSACPEQIRSLIIEVERNELVLQLKDDELEVSECLAVFGHFCSIDVHLIPNWASTNYDINKWKN